MSYLVIERLEVLFLLASIQFRGSCCKVEYFVEHYDSYYVHGHCRINYYFYNSSEGFKCVRLIERQVKCAFAENICYTDNAQLLSIQGPVTNRAVHYYIRRLAKTGFIGLEYDTIDAKYRWKSSALDRNVSYLNFNLADRKHPSTALCFVVSPNSPFWERARKDSEHYVLCEHPAIEPPYRPDISMDSPDPDRPFYVRVNCSGCLGDLGRLVWKTFDSNSKPIYIKSNPNEIRNTYYDHPMNASKGFGTCVRYGTLTIHLELNPALDGLTIACFTLEGKQKKCNKIKYSYCNTIRKFFEKDKLEVAKPMSTQEEEKSNTNPLIHNVQISKPDNTGVVSATCSVCTATQVSFDWGFMKDNKPLVALKRHILNITESTPYIDRTCGLRQSSVIRLGEPLEIRGYALYCTVNDPTRESPQQVSVNLTDTDLAQLRPIVYHEWRFGDKMVVIIPIVLVFLFLGAILTDVRGSRRRPHRQSRISVDTQHSRNPQRTNANIARMVFATPGTTTNTESVGSRPRGGNDDPYQSSVDWGSRSYPAPPHGSPELTSGAYASYATATPSISHAFTTEKSTTATGESSFVTSSAFGVSKDESSRSRARTERSSNNFTSITEESRM